MFAFADCSPDSDLIYNIKMAKINVVTIILFFFNKTINVVWTIEFKKFCATAYV